MDFLLIAVALVGLILFKSVLAGKERNYQNNRAERKMKRILLDARLNRTVDEVPADAKSREKAKPPPLPGADDD